MKGMSRRVGGPPERAPAPWLREPSRLLALAQDAGEQGRTPDPTICAAAAAVVAHVRFPSGAALAAALLGVLTTPHPIAALETLAATGVTARLLPEVEALRWMPAGGRHKDVYRHTLVVVAQTPPDAPLRLAALLHDVGKPPTKVVERSGVHFPGHAEVGAGMARRRLRELGFDAETVEAVTSLVALHLRINSYEADWTDAATRRLAREAGAQYDRLLALSRADVTSARREAVERALRRVDAFAARVAALRAAEDQAESPIDGVALMAMFNRPPGRWIGAVKAYLAGLVEAGTLAPDDADGAADLARAFVAAHPET